MNEMTLEEAISYCFRHANEFKAKMYEAGENGERQFECLIGMLEEETIQPNELPNYGMNF